MKHLALSFGTTSPHREPKNLCQVASQVIDHLHHKHTDGLGSTLCFMSPINTDEKSQKETSFSSFLTLNRGYFVWLTLLPFGDHPPKALKRHCPRKKHGGKAGSSHYDEVLKKTIVDFSTISVR